MGGIFYFVDVEQKPVLGLEWDMKLCWPHCEALIAGCSCWWYSGGGDFIQWFHRVKEYLFAHFSDPEYPEWYGHLHRTVHL